MKKNITLIFTVGTIVLTGCCTASHSNGYRCMCQDPDFPSSEARSKLHGTTQRVPACLGYMDSSPRPIKGFERGSCFHGVGGWTSSEVAAPDSIEGQLRAQGKHWVKITGEITVGAYVQDILEGRLDQPKGRGAIGKVTFISTGNNGVPAAMVDFGRGNSAGINLSQLSLVGIVRE